MSLVPLLLAASISGGSVSGMTLPAYETVDLPNGMKVLLMPRHEVPLVAFSAWVAGGDLADPTDRPGVSALLAELLTKGAGKRNAPAFSSAIDGVGGRFSVVTTSETLILRGEFLAKDQALMVSLLADVLRRPTLEAKELEKLKDRAVNTIRNAKENQPDGIIDAYFNAFVFAEHPYGRIPSETSLAKITHADVTTFFKNHVGADRTVLAVVGDFETKTMVRTLKKTFGRWKKAAAKLPTAPTLKSLRGRRVLLVDKPDATQTYFRIGNVGIARTDPDRALVDVVNTTFGGRFTAMLNDALRVKSGLTYGARSNVDRRRTPGTMTIRSYTKTETSEKALDMALDVLGNLHKGGVPQDVLSSVQTYILGQYPPRLETNPALASKLAELTFYGLGRNEVDGYAKQIQAATPQKLTPIIKRVYPQDDLVFVLIGNATALRDWVKKYGPVTEMKISTPRFTPE